MHLKMSSAKWRPFCLGLNLLIANLRELTISCDIVHLYFRTFTKFKYGSKQKFTLKLMQFGRFVFCIFTSFSHLSSYRRIVADFMALISYPRVIRPNSQISLWTGLIFRNTPFCNKSAHFCYNIVHCGIIVRCIVGFVRGGFCSLYFDWVVLGTRCSSEI